MWRNYLIFCLTLSYVLSQQELVKISKSTNGFTIIKGESETITLGLDQQISRQVSISFRESIEGRIRWTPKTITIPANVQNSNFTITVVAEKPGKIEVEGDATPTNIIDDFDIFFKIVVANSRPLIVTSVVVGWIYFVAWSVSFYPQLILNFRRKSVVGLSFDFLALNIIGHTLYAVFNCSLYFVKYFQDEYFRRFPHGLNPVELNDVFFSTHASVLTALTILQCFIYERGNQRVSKITWGLIGIFGITALVMIILALTWERIHWLDFLYACSYIKLAVTLTKYVPQAYLNYKRKSTVGWSIENILLDFTGGVLSMAQMIFNAYNYDDWASFIGDPTKFGLGLFSVLFDIVFILQHYVFYRNARKETSNPSKSEATEISEATVEKV